MRGNSLKVVLISLPFLMLGHVIKAQDQSPANTSNKAIPTQEYVFACTLSGPELQQRKAEISKELFAHISGIKELEAGYQLLFEDTEGMALRVADFMLAEHACCPFLNFDLSVGANGTGIELGITGPPTETKSFMGVLFEEMGVTHLLKY